MDKLKIGKYEFDVSNISVDRQMIGRILWQKACSNPNISERAFNNKIIKVGLYLLRQEAIVLRRKMPTVEVIKEKIKRWLITPKYIMKLSKPELDDFVGWAHFVLTGEKKKTAIIKKDLTMVLNKITEQMNEEEFSGFTSYCTTSLLELAGKWSTLKHTPKKN